MPVITQIKLRKDTAADWTSVNPVLAEGEPGLETDTGKEKRGDGVTAWNSLAYHNPGGAIPQSQVTDLTSVLAGKAASVHTHAQSDVTGLTTALAGKADSSHTQNASTIITSSNDKTASYTIVAGDKNTFIRSTSATAITITLANVLAVGETINFIQWGAGQVTFAAGAGVTIGSVDSKLKINKQYSGATVTCVASGVYSLVGDLAA